MLWSQGAGGGKQIQGSTRLEGGNEEFCSAFKLNGKGLLWLSLEGWVSLLLDDGTGKELVNVERGRVKSKIGADGCKLPEGCAFCLLLLGSLIRSIWDVFCGLCRYKGWFNLVLLVGSLLRSGLDVFCGLCRYKGWLNLVLFVGSLSCSCWDGEFDCALDARSLFSGIIVEENSKAAAAAFFFAFR